MCNFVYVVLKHEIISHYWWQTHLPGYKNVILYYISNQTCIQQKMCSNTIVLIRDLCTQVIYQRRQKKTYKLRFHLYKTTSTFLFGCCIPFHLFIKNNDDDFLCDWRWFEEINNFERNGLSVRISICTSDEMVCPDKNCKFFAILCYTSRDDDNR